MIRYVLRRVGLGLLVVAGVVLLTFVIGRMVPGDPAVAWVGMRATAGQLSAARHSLGLDRPAYVQLLDYFRGVATGDWGVSIHTHRSVLADIAVRAPASLELAGAGVLLGLAVGIPLGLAAARWHGKTPDFLIRLGAVVCVSLPVFWLALVLQMLFFQRLRLLPVGGQYDDILNYTSPLHQYTHMAVVDAVVTGNWPVFWSSLRHLVLPVIVVAVYPAGVIARMVRASVLDTVGEDHILMVRALGIPERSVYGRFAMRSALNPVLTVAALVFAYSLAGLFLVEAIFNWPGLGSYAADSIASLDIPAILGVSLVIALVYVVCNLLVDLLQAVIDPRIRMR